MSGWNRQTGHYEVLLSAMRRWHAGGHAYTAHCWCASKGGYSEKTLVEHLRERGFDVEDDEGNVVLRGGPGIEEGSTDALYEAVSGRRGRNPAWSRRPSTT